MISSLVALPRFVAGRGLPKDYATPDTVRPTLTSQTSYLHERSYIDVGVRPSRCGLVVLDVAPRIRCSEFPLEEFPQRENFRTHRKRKPATTMAGRVEHELRQHAIQEHRVLFGRDHVRDTREETCQAVRPHVWRQLQKPRDSVFEQRLRPLRPPHPTVHDAPRLPRNLARSAGLEPATLGFRVPYSTN